MVENSEEAAQPIAITAVKRLSDVYDLACTRTRITNINALTLIQTIIPRARRSRVGLCSNPRFIGLDYPSTTPLNIILRDRGVAALRLLYTTAVIAQ